jgi:hypothetical protein
VVLLPEEEKLQGGGLLKEGASAWPLAAEFMMLQKRILEHIEVETKKVY